MSQCQHFTLHCMSIIMAIRHKWTLSHQLVETIYTECFLFFAIVLVINSPQTRKSITGGLVTVKAIGVFAAHVALSKESNNTMCNHWLVRFYYTKVPEGWSTHHCCYLKCLAVWLIVHRKKRGIMGGKTLGLPQLPQDMCLLCIFLFPLIPSVLLFSASLHCSLCLSLPWFLLSTSVSLSQGWDVFTFIMRNQNQVFKYSRLYCALHHKPSTSTTSL